MLLKGVALAQLAYGSFTLKHNRDIDLYVPPESALKAMQRLEAEGYALSAPRAFDSGRRSALRSPRYAPKPISSAACLARCSRSVRNRPVLRGSPTPFLQRVQNRFGPEPGEKAGRSPAPAASPRHSSKMTVLS